MYTDPNLELLVEQMNLTEGKKQSVQFLQSKNIPEDAISKIVELDATPSKNDSISLGKFFIDIGNFNSLEHYYNKYLQFKTRNKIKDINQFKTFTEWEHEIDALGQNYKTKSDSKGEKTSEEVKQEKIYEDNNFEIYLATDIKKACDYGHKLGGNYSFCISRTGSGNLFSSYRLRAESAFYFIKSKNRSSDVVNGSYEDPSHMIVLDVQGNNNLQWTWADNGSQGHGTENVTWEKVLTELPELKVPYNKGIFKPIPLSAEEEDKLRKFQNMNNETFKTLPYELKEEYVKSTLRITDDMFGQLDKDLRNEFIGQGPELSEYMQKSLTPREAERWKTTRLMILSALFQEK